MIRAVCARAAVGSAARRELCPMPDPSETFGPDIQDRAGPVIGGVRTYPTTRHQVVVSERHTALGLERPRTDDQIARERRSGDVVRL